MTSTTRNWRAPEWTALVVLGSTRGDSVGHRGAKLDIGSRAQLAAAVTLHATSPTSDT